MTNHQDTSTERERFEVWITPKLKAGSHLNKSASGIYLDNRVAAKWSARQAALASRDEASQQPQGLPLHIGACIVDGTLHTTVMNRKPDGCVTILATAEMSVDSLMNHDCLAEMQPQGRRATQAQIERARHEYANEDIGIDDDALVSESDDGVWVQGWLWIQNEDADANVEPT